MVHCFLQSPPVHHITWCLTLPLLIHSTMHEASQCSTAVAGWFHFCFRVQLLHCIVLYSWLPAVNDIILAWCWIRSSNLYDIIKLTYNDIIKLSYIVHVQQACSKCIMCCPVARNNSMQSTDIAFGSIFPSALQVNGLQYLAYGVPQTEHA